jgi:hypothetical protein
VWALLMGVLLRRAAFAGIEALVCSRARRALDVSRSFGDDALSYFTERLDPAVTRQAAITAVRHAKRHKAFDDCAFIGLALDGTSAGRSRKKVCPLCRPYRNKQREILGYHHQLVMISVVGTGLTLPLDVQPYGPGESEYHAGGKLLRRTVANTARDGDCSVARSGTPAAALPTTWWSTGSSPPPPSCTRREFWACTLSPG